MTNAPSDPHLTSIDTLTKAGDWAGLLRYWMAFNYPAALKRATDLTREHTKTSLLDENNRWTCLLSLLERLSQGLSNSELPSDWELFQWSKSEQITLTLLDSYADAFLCEAAKQAPHLQQEQLFSLGIMNAEIGFVQAKKLDERALQAMFLSLMARGNQNLSELEREGRSLKGHASPAHHGHVKEALESLGLLHEMNELKLARTCYEKALEIYSELDTQQPGICTTTIAERCNNLGYIHWDLNDLHAASAYFTQALQHYRKLSTQQPDVYRKSLAATLNNLGSVQVHDPSAARANLTEALQFYRQLAVENPAHYRPLIEGILHRIGDAGTGAPSAKMTSGSQKNTQLAVSWLEKGMAFDEVEQWREAIACYDKALEFDRSMVPAWSHKGNSLQQDGRRKEALECFNQALKLDGTFFKAWIGKGDILSNSLLDDQGGMMLDISDKPDLLNKVHTLEEAIEAYRRFIDYAPPEFSDYVDVIKARCEELKATTEFFTSLMNDEE
jgi:tetratricopeptide (TPR) repeat protein